jgi:hypothetical protein
MTSFEKKANAAEKLFVLASKAFNREIEAKNFIWVNISPKKDFTRMPLLEGAIQGLFRQFYPDKEGKVLVVFNQDNATYTTFQVLIEVGTVYFLASMRLDGEKVTVIDIEESTNPLTVVSYSYKQGKWHQLSYSDKY